MEISPATPPLPTIAKRPFQVVVGSHSSIWVCFGGQNERGELSAACRLILEVSEVLMYAPNLQKAGRLGTGEL